MPNAGIALSAALVLALAPAAASRPETAPTTIGTRGTVESISADGVRVAIHARLAGDRDCHSGSVWTPSSGAVVRLRDSPCGKRASDLQYDGLTLAGSRLAWNDYDFGNHAYCYGPYTSTMVNPGRVSDLGVCEGEFGDPDQLWQFAGDAALLVARSYTRCEASCAPDYSGTYDGDVVLWRIGSRIERLAREKNDAKLLDVEAGRILVLRPGGELVVYSAAGKTVAALRLGRGAVDGGAFSGTHVLARKGELRVYNPATGKLVTRREIRVSGRLQDVEQGLAVYLTTGEVRVIRLADGRDRAVAKVRGLVEAELEASGLFFAYNVPGGGAKPGRVAYVPLSAVRNALGG